MCLGPRAAPRTIHTAAANSGLESCIYLALIAFEIGQLNPSHYVSLERCASRACKCCRFATSAAAALAFWRRLSPSPASDLCISNKDFALRLALGSNDPSGVKISKLWLSAVAPVSWVHTRTTTSGWLHCTQSRCALRTPVAKRTLCMAARATTSRCPKKRNTAQTLGSSSPKGVGSRCCLVKWMMILHSYCTNTT
eukprot:COSAG02_NODE_3152_length_7273_cov_30.318372_3_plen_196_part_00